LASTVQRRRPRGTGFISSAYFDCQYQEQQLPFCTGGHLTVAIVTITFVVSAITAGILADLAALGKNQ